MANKPVKSRVTSMAWCPEEDSNLHGFHHWYLKPARLPIPPPGLTALCTFAETALSIAGSKRSALLAARMSSVPPSPRPRLRCRSTALSRGFHSLYRSAAVDYGTWRKQDRG